MSLQSPGSAFSTEGSAAGLSNFSLMLMAIALLALAHGLNQSADGLVDGWNDVPASARARMYWRVFGPAWDRANIERQLKIVKDAGLGGLVTYFFYPVALDQPGKWHNQPFNSPEFLENLSFAAKRARDVGLRFGVCGSTGWPYGGSKVTVGDSAQMLVKVAGTCRNGAIELAKPISAEAGDRLIALFQAGKLIKSPAEGPVVAFVQRPTRMQVKRPSLGNEGLVVDHLNADAVTRYLQSTVEPMLDSALGNIESLFSDSLEVYRQNWTADLPGQFRHRRGYDLIPHLLDLFDDTSPDAPQLRQDLWRTVAELAEERYVKTITEWAHTKNVVSEQEPYGTPPLPLTCAQYIDIPTGEQYEWRDFNFCRYVASGAHLAGKNIVGSEAWTWGSIPNRLTDSLSDLKVLSDMHFVSGVNDITGVDYPYSPAEAGIPGWLPYFGPSMNENNPQWAVFPELVSYLNRCSWMLRQGRPANKVAVYLPVEDIMAKGGTEQLLLDFGIRDFFSTGAPTTEFGLHKALTHRSELVETLIRNGIGFDGIDLWAVNRLSKPLVASASPELRVGEASYRIIVLPNLDSIDLAALRRLDSAAKAGVILVATGRLPSRACGLAGQGADTEVLEIVHRLFPSAAGLEPKRTGSCTTYFLNSAGDLSILAELGGAQCRLHVGEQTVAVVKRDLPDGEIYFVANPSDSPANFSLEPIPARPHLEIWNPVTGRIGTVSGRLVNSRLDARGSRFIVARQTASLTAAPAGHFGDLRSHSVVLQTLDKPWRLSFKGPDAPPDQPMLEPAYWETVPGCGTFSGEGIYRTVVEYQGAIPVSANLRLPEVHDAAVVFVNGKRAGTVWLPPYNLDISKFIRQGVNELELHVFSSMANRFIGLPDMDIAALRAQYGNRFSAPGEKRLMQGPEHAGIQGQVTVSFETPEGPQ